MISGQAAFPLGDFLAIAERVLEVDGTDLLKVVKIGSAESALNAPFASFEGQGFYSDPVTQAGILCSRIIRNHPLPDGNKRTAFLCMRMHLQSRGLDLHSPDQKATAEIIEQLAAREIQEEQFIDWLRERVT